MTLNSIASLLLIAATAGTLEAQPATPTTAHTAAQEPAPGAYDPVADPHAVVREGHARFTVLTPQLIRMEWSATEGDFEDRSSFTFLNRRMSVPAFHVQHEAGAVVIQSDALKLTYKPEGDGRFTAGNLSVELLLNGKLIDWHPGMDASGNLLGTTRTLDRIAGDKLDEPMDPGLVSRDGWSIVDDTKQPLFTSSDFSFAAGEKSPWPWVVLRTPDDRQDWYFFGYGHDYKLALSDYVKVAGRIPLPPRYAFGAWWTRYWPYTDRELDDLVKGYNQNNLPLDVMVIDMDWHISRDQLLAKHEVDQSGQKQFGWTGYTWNKELFPYPEDFLQKLHREGLKVTLNLHPASGVQTWEEPYPAMARAMGIDPASKKYVPFEILDRKFAQNYMDILHHPLEKQGVDFWWLDWQQGTTTNTPGVNSTWWLNYVHFTDQQREGKRPLLFGRYGGLGDHRYQTGFSGDVISGWDSLAFQPWFTATAANVGYAYWSHDLGGHIPGPIDSELYTRWVQFGAFSPIFRTHTAPSPYGERRVWAYPEPYDDVMRDVFHLRYAMLPYIYTESRRTYDTGVAFLRPLYYDWPDAGDSYNYRNEYQFGENMIVAPVVAPADPATGLTKVKTWVPPGEWIEAQTGKCFNGPAAVEASYALDEIPRFVRAGAVVPMAPPMLRSNERPVDPLIVQVYPMQDGKSSAYTMYDDGSDGEKYQRGEDAWTQLSARQSAGLLNIHIAPVKGSFSGMVQQRGYEIRLPGSWPPASVTANGRPLAYQPLEGKPGWRFVGDELMTVITIPRTSVHQAVDVKVHVTLDLAQARWKLDGIAGLLTRLRETHAAMSDAHGTTSPPDILDDAMETGDRITYHPETAAREIDHLLAIHAQLLSAVRNAEANSEKRIPGALARSDPDQNSDRYKQRAAGYRNSLAKSIAYVEDSANNMPRKP